APEWTQLVPVGTPPSGSSRDAIYDPVRDRMVLFGGSGGTGGNPANDTWTLSLSGTPAWNQMTTAGAPPSPVRQGFDTIYDPLRDRMVVFGGYSDATFDPYNDTFGLSFSGVPTWTQLTPTGLFPSARFGSASIYDPLGDRMVMFGGSDGNSAFDPLQDDAWALSLSDTPAWTRLIESGPPPSLRDSHTAIRDPVRDRMLVFGGFDYVDAHPLNDVSAISLADPPMWTQSVPSGTPPSPRWGAASIYDPVRDRMVVFGGLEWNPTQSCNDTWALSLSGPPAWSPLIPSGALPPARHSLAMVYDPVRDRMIILGGFNYPSDSSYNNTWALSFDGTLQWTLLLPTGVPPSARTGHSAIYDPIRDRIIVFGGSAGYSNSRNDVWALSLADPPSWTQLSPAGTLPSARQFHTAVYDAPRDRMVVFGGTNWTDYLSRDDVWALSLSGTPAWTQLAPSGTLPPARDSHTGIYDDARGRMVIFGGYHLDEENYFYLNDTWSLDWGAVTAVTEVPRAKLNALAYPNPFNPATTISYVLPAPAVVRLEVFDVRGQLVATPVDGVRQGAGEHTLQYRSNAPSGVYFVRLSAGRETTTRKIVLLK
ncbi:MAG TPA: kelch repeat-containing protein, partial [Candidatus Krumholzibacteria bacterium]|nr:kelch repeat-containing protein [Candidatus Krumholzibacteria bacterium]